MRTAFLILLVACGGDRPAPVVAPTSAGPKTLTAKSFPLPGATGPISTDYIVCDRPAGRVWVPVGDTGSADVFDVASNAFTRVDGFATGEREVRGKTRKMGPSAVTIGEGFAFIGDRATAEVCAVDLKTLEKKGCLKLPVPTDGVSWVASMKEIWVTTPKDNSLTVLDASKPDALAAKLTIKTEGEVEGYAVDGAHGLFFTNLEDKNKTLVVDVKTHTVRSTWASGCSEAGPRGVAVDPARGFVFVACTDSLRVLDAAHDGALLSTVDTGAGVDNIELDEATKLLYVAAGKSQRLTIVKVDDKGGTSIVATGATAEGARNPTVDARGNTYIVDPTNARLLVFGVP
jgi:hypothetical protein